MPLSTNPAPPSLFRCASTRIADSPAAFHDCLEKFPGWLLGRAHRSASSEDPFIANRYSVLMSICGSTALVSMCQPRLVSTGHMAIASTMPASSLQPPASIHPSRDAVLIHGREPPAWPPARRTAQNCRLLELGRV
ncbi:hypothetical protein BU16DRAFT_554692 [Lophium mytilinum]|uniref:Uncharacterized protein n=1 Tax=Lophium mytilinum TaxID=390894 RepID=A0A6A6RE40_9PEZI|nr:hypothetical protein BU16DRAFT_554692 [Lophium mytilinum]